MIPKLKNTAPSSELGSGQAAHKAQQQTTPLYRQSLSNSTPNSDSYLDDTIERQYWMRRCEDDLYRALSHFKTGDLKLAQRELDDFDQSMARIQEIKQ